MYKGFEPVFDKNSKILILGSFPSVISRNAGFYYANPKNRFWNVLSQIFSIDIGDSAEEKKKFLSEHKIALWDIVYKCEIKGSSDSDLKCVCVSDLNKIFSIAKIEKIICNGRCAYQIFCRHYKDLKQICAYLPSTSPANFRFDIELWKNELK